MSDMREEYFEMMERVLDYIEITAINDEVYKRTRTKILRLFNAFDRRYFLKNENEEK